MPTNQTEVFVQHLTESQNRLYGYIYSLLADHTAAHDVLQETNLVLWRKIEEFDASRPFLPWAFGIARFQVMANLRDRKRDRLLLDEDLAAQIAIDCAPCVERLEDTREALRSCLQKLPDASRDLIQRRYMRAMSVGDVASAVDRSVGAIKVALLRARRQLARCVEQTLAEEGTR